MRRILACAAITVALVIGGAGTAMAGETRGNGTENDNNGKPHSACHFSGQDVADSEEGNPAPEFDDDWATERGNQKHGFHGVQNWGSYVRAGVAGDLIAAGMHPGEACNGSGG